MRVSIIGATVIDWSTFIAVAQDFYPTEDIDNSGRTVGPATAWALANKKLFGTDTAYTNYHLYFVAELPISCILRLTVFGVKVLGTKDTEEGVLTIFSGNLDSLFEAVTFFCRDNSTKRERQLGNYLYDTIQVHAPGQYTLVNRVTQKDGTWAIQR